MTALPRAVWMRAPFALVRHVGVLVAILAAALLVALAAASAPLLRAGAESEALKTKLAELTPLGAGLTIESRPAPLHDDAPRRAAAARLAARVPDLRAPIATESTIASVPVARGGRPLTIVPMARDEATAHVKRLSGDGHGAWLASEDAKFLGVHAGDMLTLTDGVGGPPVRVRIGAIYLQLDLDIDNPYWVNFTIRIRQRNPDKPPLPTFLFVDRAQLFHIAHVVNNDIVQTTYELPVAPDAMTPARARALVDAFAEVRRGPRGLGCPCSITSPLSAQAHLAALSVDALTPVIGLLAAFAAALGVAAALVAGAFGARRRAGETRLSLVGGESAAAFALRAVVESFLPALLGAAVGLGVAFLLVGAFTPSGTIEGRVARSAAGWGAVGLAGAIAATAIGALVARGPLVAREHPRLRLPWELLPGAAAGALIVTIERGGGLTSNAAVGAHPRLVVLGFPLVVTAAVAGLFVRLVRRPLRRLRPHHIALFLAVRRLAAARSLLVTLVVTAAVAFAAVAFAEALDRTLQSSVREKAYVANGADVQGVIDPYQGLPKPLPYPAARVVEDFESARVVGSPHSLELMSVRPAELAPVIRWEWEGDPATSLRRLARDRATLPAIANQLAAHTKEIVVEGRRIPVHVVDVVRSFPGMVEGEDVLVVPAAKLERLVHRPYDAANAYVWVRGPALPVTRALERASPAPDYITTVHHFLQTADLGTATRTYGYVRLVALGAALVALVALLLYLHARARSQLVTAALLERMGLGAARRTLAMAIEAAALVGFAAAIGLVCAVAAAGPVVTRVDPVAQYAPAPALDLPRLRITASYVAIVFLAALAGALAAQTRGDLAQAVRVA